MKKIYSIAAGVLLLAGAGTAKADSMMFNNPENEAYFGARVALDISSAATEGSSIPTSRASLSARSIIFR